MVFILTLICKKIIYHLQKEENEVVKILKRTKKALAEALTAGMIAGAVSTPVAAETAGWKKDNVGWWYQYSNGSYAANKWEKINGVWYYFNEKGYMLENEWAKDSSGKWYYLGADGAMKTNAWIKEQYSSVKNSAYGDSRDLYDWYYVGKDGAMEANTWVEGKYYLTEDGTMKKGGFVDYKGDKYFVDADGVMQSGVVKLKDKVEVYYFDEDGTMKTGKVEIDGVEYNFDESGKCTDEKTPETDKVFDISGTTEDKSGNKA